MGQAPCSQQHANLAVPFSSWPQLPDQAIAILKYRSQRTNRKLRIIADELIRIHDLEPAPTVKERNRLGDADDPRPYRVNNIRL
jgi:hypothetical protein